jgi:hypothetical protein
MKNASSFLTVLLGFGAILFGFTGFQNPDAETRQISVTGDAEVRVVPDEVVLTLGVQTWDEDIELAKHKNDQIVKRVTQLTERYGIPAKHVQTDYISVEPRFDDNYEQRGFIGFFVRKTISIRLRDLSKFERFLTDVLGTGVNYVHGIKFRTTELRKYRDQARALATNAAKEKAAAMAQELDQQIGEPLQIREEQVGWWSWYGSSWWGSRWERMTQNVIQNAGGNVSVDEDAIAVGQITVSARVSVSFLLH